MEQVTSIYTPDEYLSLPCLTALLERPFFSRKEVVFLIKMVFWSRSSLTHLLSELKYYGEERKWIDLLRCETIEENPKILLQIPSITPASHVIMDLYSYLKNSTMLPEDADFQIYLRDIPLFEDIFRRAYTKKVSFQELKNTLLELGNTTDHELFALEYIQHIYEHVPARPQ